MEDEIFIGKRRTKPYEVGVHSRFHRRVPRSCIFPKDGEDDPKAYPLLLDKMLNRTMALRVKVQPTFSSASVQRFSKKPEVIQAVLDQIDPDEGTSKHEVLEVIQTVGHTNDEPKPQVEKSDADESVHFHTVPKCYK